MDTPALNPSNPIYFQLESDLRKNILEKRLNAGAAIPAETELARKYQISRNTARKAIQNLVREGLLHKVQGSGTFVTEHADNNAPVKTRQVVLLGFSTSLSQESFYEESTYLPVMEGLNRVLTPNNYNLVVAYVGSDMSPPPCLLRKDVDGIIIDGEPSPEFYERYIKQLPHVGIQYVVPQLSYPCVKSDNQRLMHLAVERLKNMGHRNIEFVSSCIDKYMTKENYYAFLLAMDALNLKVNPDPLLVWQRPKVNGIIPMETEMPDLTERIEKTFASSEKPTAFICSDWLYAQAIIRAVENMGLKVPDDVSVICRYNDKRESVRKKITGYSTRFADICADAARMLLGMISEGTYSPNIVLVPPQLLEDSATIRERMTI